MSDYHIGAIPSVSLILLYGERKGKPYTGPSGNIVKRIIAARNGGEVYKTTGTFYYGDPYQHPNSFERAFEELESLRKGENN